MSRIGKMPVAIPAGVTVTIAENNEVTVKGPKGTLSRVLPAEMSIKEEDGHIVVTRPNDLKQMKSLHGLTRTLINNMIHGVTEGYEKVLVDKNRAIVEGVNMVSKSTKPNAKNPQGGIVKQEASIHLSNLNPVDPKTGKATRISRKVTIGENGKKTIVRVSKKSGEEIK